MGYYRSLISPFMYREIETIVNEILDHPEKYKSRKSISEYSRYLKELAKTMEHHQAQPIIRELRENLMMYCKQNSEITVGPAFIRENLYQLKDMTEPQEEEQQE